MTAVPSIDPARFLNEQLSQASPDLLRDLLTTFVNALLSAQADAVCGAGYGERHCASSTLTQHLAIIALAREWSPAEWCMT